jgi:hypothetical protein
MGGLALCAAALVPLAFIGGEKPLPAADHLDPPQRTNPNSDETPDIAADIADLYVTHDDEVIVMTVTFGGPSAPELPAFYDEELLFTISVSNREPRTTTDIPIRFQFGQETGVEDGPWGVRVTNVPGVDGDVVGSVERIIEQNGVRVFAGLVDDPFFFDSQGLSDTRATGDLSFREDRDFFGAQNITAFAIEIPRDRIENGGNLLDIWTFSDRLGGQLDDE